jgi:hypothetical protein
MSNFCDKCGQRLPGSFVLTPNGPKRKVSHGIDPRFNEFIAALDAGYKKRRWDFGFDAAAGKKMNELLKLRPSWDVLKFQIAVRNYFASEGVLPAALPRTYLGKLPSFEHGPLDKFGKLQTKVERMVSVEG